MAPSRASRVSHFFLSLSYVFPGQVTYRVFLRTGPKTREPDRDEDMSSCPHAVTHGQNPAKGA